MTDEYFKRQITALNGQIIGSRAVQSSIIKILKDQFHDEDIASKLSLLANTSLKSEQDELKPEQFSAALEYIREAVEGAR
jgi:hypothetical protein